MEPASTGSQPYPPDGVRQDEVKEFFKCERCKQLVKCFTVFQPVAPNPLLKVLHAQCGGVAKRIK